MKERKSRTRYPVTPQQFVAAWTAAASVEEVAAALNMPPRVVVGRANYYRHEKVNLKRLPRRRPARRLDVAALNDIAAGTGRP